MKEIGVQKTQLDTLVLHENIALSMADVLTFNTSIFIKQYGRATLSTVAFRGTAAIAHAGDVERHAHQLADAGHDRFFDDSRPTSSTTRRCCTAPRRSTSRAAAWAVRSRWRPNPPIRRASDCSTPRASGRSGRRTNSCVSPTATTAGRPPRAWSTPRRPTNIPVPEPRQEGKHLRRRPQHHRHVLSPAKSTTTELSATSTLLQEAYYNTGNGRPVRPERLADRLEARAGAHDDRLRRSEEIHQRTARTHAAQRAVVGSPAPELESRGQGRIHLQLVRLRLRQRRGQRETGRHDQLPELVPHALRLGRRGILHRPQMALHGTGRPAPAFRHEQRPQESSRRT